MTTSILNLKLNYREVLTGIDRVESKMMGFSRSVSKLTLPLLALGGISTKVFGDMEQGITNVQNLLDGGETNKFSSELEGIQESAIEAGFGIEDVNKALFDNVSALGEGQISLKAFEQAQKLAKGGSAELSETVNGITNVINAYGRETTDATEVANAFFTAQQKGKTTVAELANNIGKVAPTAKSAGIGFKELLATMATLTLGGLSTDEATTSLRATISALVKPTKEAEKVLKGLGVPVGALELKEKGLGFALSQLSKAQEENADILAKAIPNIRALTGVTSFSADKLQILQKTQDKINKDIKDGTGLNEAYTAVLDDFNNVTNELTGSSKTLLNQIGALVVEGLDLKNMFIDLKGFVLDLKDGLKEMDKETKSSIASWGAFAIGVPIVTTAIATTLSVVSKLSAAFVLMGKSAKAAMTNPYVLAALAGVALGNMAASAAGYDSDELEKKSIESDELSKKLAKETADLKADILKIEADSMAEWEKIIAEIDLNADFTTKPIDIGFDIDSLLKDTDKISDKIFDEIAIDDLIALSEKEGGKKSPQQTQTQLAGAFEVGSYEAYKLQTQNEGNRTDKKIEKYTKETATNTKTSGVTINTVSMK